jgi:cell division protein FtsQ
MKMKISKKILRISLWSLSAAGLIISLGFAGKKHMEMASKGLKIRIADNTGNYFIEPRDVAETLSSRGRKVKGLPMHDINISLLEKIVYTIPFVEKAEVYSTIDGYVNIDVWQRDPVIRIINHDNEHFYIDNKGEFMPVSSKFSRPVVVASGFIFDNFAQKSLQYAVPFTQDTLRKPVLVQLNEIALFLRKNDFWDAQVEQIYVNDKSEMELIPRIGDHRILLGSTENLEEKMNNLFIFYSEGLNKAGWEKYSLINLKYANQVVCTKRPD